MREMVWLGQSALAWFALAGCSSENPLGSTPATGERSGTRLTVQTYVGSDGSRSSGELFDNELHTFCAFKKAADGSTRCLPTSVAASAYADSDCAQSLAVVPCGESIPRFVVLRDSVCASVDRADASVRAAHVHPIAEPYSGPVYRKTASRGADAGASESCRLEPTNTTGDVYRLGPEVPASSFVAGRLMGTVGPSGAPQFF